MIDFKDVFKKRSTKTQIFLLYDTMFSKELSANSIIISMPCLKY